MGLGAAGVLKGENGESKSREDGGDKRRQW